MSGQIDIVKKLWSFAKILKDDGVTYLQYTTELTYLLFLKMNHELGKDEILPDGLRWNDLITKTGSDQFNFYRKMLLELGLSENSYLQSIFLNASTSIREPKNLNTLITNINKLDWYSIKNREGGLADLYEGLVEKTGNEGKKGAGQYYTPRSIINVAVRLVKPKTKEIIQDPAAGTGGFLIASDRYIKKNTDQLFSLKVKEQEFQRKDAFKGIELIVDSHRICMMNLYLHDINANIIRGKDLPKSNLIITNPPFGTSQKDNIVSRDDLVFQTSNKQLGFLQHIYKNLIPGGRAAVIFPDSVLSIEGIGVDIRKEFLENCILHTILRLPQGIFYTPSVRTNLLFFYKKKNEEEKNKYLWVYDYRTSIPKFGKSKPLTELNLSDFEKKFGNNEYGNSNRLDEGIDGRFRKFSYVNIEKNNYNLDIRWLKAEEIQLLESLPDTTTIIKDIKKNLQNSINFLNKMKNE
jgi:type I restriction enzyme M protein